MQRDSANGARIQWSLPAKPSHVIVPRAGTGRLVRSQDTKPDNGGAWACSGSSSWRCDLQVKFGDLVAERAHPDLLCLAKLAVGRFQFAHAGGDFHLCFIAAR
jgi:hypothetical protein